MQDQEVGCWTRVQSQGKRQKSGCALARIGHRGNALDASVKISDNGDGSAPAMHRLSQPTSDRRDECQSGPPRLLQQNDLAAPKQYSVLSGPVPAGCVCRRSESATCSVQCAGNGLDSKVSGYLCALSSRERWGGHLAATWSSLASPPNRAAKLGTRDQSASWQLQKRAQRKCWHLIMEQKRRRSRRSRGARCVRCEHQQASSHAVRDGCPRHTKSASRCGRPLIVSAAHRCIWLRWRWRAMQSR